MDTNYHPRKDYSGHQFNNWTIIRPLGCLRPAYMFKGKLTKLVIAVYEARCVCGKVQPVRMDDLRGRKSKMCYECSQKRKDSILVRKKAQIKRDFNNPPHAGRLGYWNDLLSDIPRRYAKELFQAAKSRGIQFDLKSSDINDLWLKQNRRCALSGIELKFKDPDEYIAASIDRIDSSKGYTPDNIQIVSRKINKMKVDIPQERFFEMIKSILEHRNAG